jgi:hypothetical protein
MKRTLRRLGLSCIVGITGVGVAILLLTRTFAADKPPAVQPPAPPPPQPNVRDVDRPKGMIEMPTKRILARQTNLAPAAGADAFVNPKVQPGAVRWHKDFDAACAAAKKSGKPVLLFQMMGKLDDRFC